MKKDDFDADMRAASLQLQGDTWYSFQFATPRAEMRRSSDWSRGGNNHPASPQPSQRQLIHFRQLTHHPPPTTLNTPTNTTRHPTPTTQHPINQQ